MKILTVEDDVVSSTVLQATLASLGHEVVSAGDGQEAWEKLGQESIRLVISDWEMPRMDGLTLCHKIRSRMEPEYVYFILLSKSGSTAENQAQARAAGVDDFLVKPVSTRDIEMRLHVAERILGFIQQIQQLESFIPICSYCKNIRQDDGFWQQIEAYISKRTRTQFSHSICPDCYERHVVPELKQQGLM